jgi:uncharacterized protein (TIGR03118 family)
MRFPVRDLWRSLRHRPTRARSLCRRPSLECLEDRSLLSANVLQTNLVSDLAGVAMFQDPHLVNPWGISESSTSPFWVSDNNAGVSSLYNTAGKPQALVVSIPSPGDPTGNSGTPTGTVFNIDLAGKGFMITDGTHTAPAVFLFATEDGTIVGWNPGVDPTGKFDGPGGASTHAVIAVDNSTNPTAADGAVYKGLTIATDANGRTLLYAANFRSGKVDVFGTDFKPVTLSPGAFTDTKLPKGYAPFNVQVLNGKVYVTYAKQNADKHDDVAGQGHGFVDVFNLDGSPGLAGGKERLISHGRLDSPWGLAIAPSSFGKLAGALLVGNFGNGRINAFDATTGHFLGELKDPDGEPIQIDGLWALKVGNGGAGGDANKVYFTAGPFHETHGLFGSLTPVAEGTPEGPAEAQMVQAALDVVQADLAIVIQDISSGAPQATINQAIQDLDAAFVQLIRAEIRFAADTRADLGSHGHGDATSSGLARRQDIEALDALFADLGRLPGDLG